MADTEVGPPAQPQMEGPAPSGLTPRTQAGTEAGPPAKPTMEGLAPSGLTPGTMADTEAGPPAYGVRSAFCLPAEGVCI